MTNKDYDVIKDRMMDLVQNGSPEVAWTATKTLVDITVALEELKIRKDCHAQQMQDRIEFRAKEIEQAAKLLAEQTSGCANSGKDPAEFPKVVVDKEREDFEYELYHQPEDEEKCSCEDAPAPGGCVVSQYCNNELIHKLIKELKTGELVNPLAKDSDVVRALQAGVCCACISTAKDPILLEAAIVEGHYVALICGGNNGDGTWSIYLDQISSIIYSLEEQRYKAWLIRLDNDCPDDVWYAYIGLSACEDI